MKGLVRFYSSINCYLKRIFLVGHSVTCYRVLFFIQSTFCKVIFVTWRQIQTECRRKLDTFIVTFQRPASPSCLLSSPFSPFVPFILFLPPSPFPSVLSLNPISNSLYIFHSLFFSILRQSPSLPIKTRRCWISHEVGAEIIGQSQVLIIVSIPVVGPCISVGPAPLVRLGVKQF